MTDSIVGKHHRSHSSKMKSLILQLNNQGEIVKQTPHSFGIGSREGN